MLRNDVELFTQLHLEISDKLRLQQFHIVGQFHARRECEWLDDDDSLALRRKAGSCNSEPDDEDDGVCCSRGAAEGRRVRDAFWPTIDGYMRCNHDAD